MFANSRSRFSFVIIGLYCFGAIHFSSSFAAAGYQCSQDTESASWVALSQYNVTKTEYYDSAGKVLESRAGHNGEFTYDKGTDKEKVGLWVPTIQGGWSPPEGWVQQKDYSYRIFSLQKHAEGGSANVVVEIDYTDLEG